MSRVVVDHRDKVIANVQFLVAAVRVCCVSGHQGGHMINHWDPEEGEEGGREEEGGGGGGGGEGGGGGCQIVTGEGVCTSCAVMSASNSWCFLSRFCTAAKSLPQSSEDSCASTWTRQKERGGISCVSLLILLCARFIPRPARNPCPSQPH